MDFGFDPLIENPGEEFGRPLPQVGGLVEPREFNPFERRLRTTKKILERWLGMAHILARLRNEKEMLKRLAGPTNDKRELIQFDGEYKGTEVPNPRR